MTRHLRHPNPRSAGQGIGEWIGIVVAALAAAFILRTFVVQSFYIPSGSMIPTLEIQDRVLVNKLSYRFGDVERGDILVFERPEGEPESVAADLIKRVVALPGETVEGRDNAVWINGERLDEPYLVAGTPISAFPPVVVPENHLWMMGDNRGDSRDSRFFGTIDQSTVVGKASIRIWPPSRVDTL